jgi:endonuclease/exonuclease/phosphatase family metal-dependent hydrolase
MPEVQALAVETGADILTGVEYWRIGTDKREYFNAALVARRDGTLSPEWTAKQYLVPFTEGVPFKSWIGPLVEGRGGEFHWLSGGFTPGPTVPLTAAGIRVGVLVCYEEFYFDLSRRLRADGADIQAVITNDAWFGRTVFQKLLSDVARMRAIETRSSIVRVANTGISGFVDPLGRFRAQTGLFEEAVEVEDVVVTAGRTLYVRVGDVVAWVAIAGLLVTIVVAASRRTTRRAGPLGVAILALTFALGGCADAATSRNGPKPGRDAAAAPATPVPALRIATWNIEWLTTRDAHVPRGPADYAALRGYAEKLDPDVIALQEVDGPQAAQLVFDPDKYRFHFTRDQDNVQRAGFAWKKELDVRPNGDVTGLAMNGRRPGADVTLRFGPREMRLLSIHLKSGCHERALTDPAEECKILRRQLPALEQWIDARASEGIPFAVLGDFNRAFRSGDEFWKEIDDGEPPQADLIDAGAGERPGCWNGRHDRFIDHIVLSPAAAQWLAPQSFQELVYEPGARGRLSDHCPLAIVLGERDRAPARGATRGATGAPRQADAGTQPIQVEARDAASHVGEQATVCGTVASARHFEDRSGVTLINLEAPYPDQPFTLVIESEDRKRFGKPEVDWLHRRVCVTGTIEPYRGKPQIVARSPEHVTLQ